VTRCSQLWPVIDVGDQAPQVVCGIFHAGGSQLPVWSRIRRIAAWNWRRLQPTQHGAAMRALARWGSQRWQETSPEEKVWFSEQHRLGELYWDNGGLNPELDWS